MAREGENNDGPPRGLAQSNIGDEVNGQLVQRPQDQNRANDLEIVIKIPCKEYKEMVARGDTLNHTVTITFERKDGDTYKCPLEIPIPFDSTPYEKCCDVPSLSDTPITITPSLSDDTSITSLSSPISNIPNIYGRQLILQYKAAMEESNENYIPIVDNSTDTESLS